MNLTNMGFVSRYGLRYRYREEPSCKDHREAQFGKEKFIM